MEQYSLSEELFRAAEKGDAIKVERLIRLCAIHPNILDRKRDVCEIDTF